MLKFLPGRYCSQIWFIPLPRMGCDILAALFRDAEHWTYVWRFRYDNGERSWHELQTKLETDESQLLKKLHDVLKGMADAAAGEIHVLPVRSDDPRFIMARFTEESWAHLREPTKEESELAAQCLSGDDNSCDEPDDSPNRPRRNS